MRNKVFKENKTVQQLKDMLAAGTPLYLFDLETTGLSSATDRIVSFSAIKLIRENGIMKEQDRMNLFINPEIPIPSAVTAINHIDDYKVRNCPKEDEAVRMIRNFLGEHPLVGGYNSRSFDERFMQAMYARQFGEDFTPSLHVDVFCMAKEKLESPSYKLSVISHNLGADVGLEFHNSMDDVIATSRVLSELIDLYKEEDGLEPVIFQHAVILSANYWHGPSDRLKRIYIKTQPYSKTYYDLYREEWVTNMDFNLDAVRRDVLNLYKAQNETELMSSI